MPCLHAYPKFNIFLVLQNVILRLGLGSSINSCMASDHYVHVSTLLYMSLDILFETNLQEKAQLAVSVVKVEAANKVILPKPSRYTHPFCIRFFTFSSILMLLVEYCHVYCILWLKCYFVVLLCVNINNNFCLVFLSLKILYPYWSRLGSSTEMGKRTFLIMFVIHVLS